MDVTRIVVPPLNANCYIVKSEKNNDCLLFDAGGGFDKIKEVVKENNLNPLAAVFTHGHFDHVLDGKKIRENGIKTYLTARDEKLFDGRGDLARYCGVKFEPFKIDEYLEEGDCNIGGIKFSVIFTPGHTAGSCCFLFDKFLIGGDTLFKGNFGRYDFPSGNFTDLKKSIKEKLFVLPDDIVVYTGHGDSTTIGEEKENNAINEY